MSLIEITRGDSSLVLGLPHAGTTISSDCLARLNQTGCAIADTDWHIDQLYADLMDNVTSVRTTIHRYVIDVNRDPFGQSLYPGQNTTQLCPLTDFDGVPIYHEDQEPDVTEVEKRRVAYHVPYHEALAAELNRIKAIHGFAVLYDCHSIRSKIPFLFDGTLSDFNIGTYSGMSCAPDIETAVHDICAQASGFSCVLNGRFKGGWTTRYYGRPHEGFHAIQVELAQSTYMQEASPWAFAEDKAARLRPYLKTILKTLSDWRPK